MKIYHFVNQRAKALLSTAAVAAGLAFAALPQAYAGVTKIKVGHLVSLDMAPLFVAKESGCFAKNDLDVQLVFFANPGDNNAALVGGAIDISTNPFTLPFFAANGGVPIRVVAAAGGWGVIEVVAQGRLGIGSPSELKAYVQSHDVPLKVATLQGDTLELVLTRSFDQAGIDRSKVKFVYFNDLLAMVESFRSGQVDLLSHIKPVHDGSRRDQEREACHRRGEGLELAQPERRRQRSRQDADEPQTDGPRLPGESGLRGQAHQRGSAEGGEPLEQGQLLPGAREGSSASVQVGSGRPSRSNPT